MSNRKEQRTKIIKQRRALSPKFQRDAAYAIAKKIFAAPFFLQSQHVAFYLPVNGEVDPTPILEQAWLMKKKCYLPILHPLKHNQLYFARYFPETFLKPNYFGILEPEFNSKNLIPAWALDLVFMPLVGFDPQGNRLGMGGGFYDRTFAFRNNKSKPYLVGLAYEMQRLPHISNEAWDIKPDYIITEKN